MDTLKESLVNLGLVADMALRLAHDLHCPVCFEVFRDPVLLSCSHSFCKACLQMWWTEKTTRECPVCKCRSSIEHPPCNLVLKNLCEAITQEISLEDNTPKPNDVCSKHGEKLRLFCFEHQQLVCLVCRDSREHSNHSFRPVDEAAQDYKVIIKEKVKLLETHRDKLTQVDQQWALTAAHIEEQGRQTEHQIRNVFDKMRVFLQKEEELRIRAVRSEVQKKSSLMEQKISELKQEIQALSETIRLTEEQQQSPNVTFLQNYRTSIQRVENMSMSDPEVLLGSLVDVAKHLGNLGFHIWCKMKKLVTYTPIVLDPNTAHSMLMVSTDLCSVTYSTERNEVLPDNYERLKNYVTVLGSEGYVSGMHNWEVELQNDAEWGVGVLVESIPRRFKITSGHWTFYHTRNGEYVVYVPPSVEKPLFVGQHPQRIRLELDCNRRTLTLSDPITNTHIYTFTNLSSERLFPFIDLFCPTHIRIAPEEFSIQKCA